MSKNYIDNYVQKNFKKVEKLCKKLNIPCRKTNEFTPTLAIEGNDDRLMFIISGHPTMVGAGLFGFVAPAMGIKDTVYLSLGQIENIILSAVQDVNS